MLSSRVNEVLCHPERSDRTASPKGEDLAFAVILSGAIASPEGKDLLLILKLLKPRSFGQKTPSG